MNSDLDEDTIERLNEVFSRVTYHRVPAQFTGVPDPKRARRRKVWMIVAGSTAVAALATGGIAAARRGLPDAVTYATDVRSPSQAAALDDDEVTFDEYKAGFQRFVDCMQRDGRPISDITFNTVTQLYSYIYDGVDDCYDRELYAVDLSWQTSDERPRDPLHPDISLDEIRAACAQDGASPPVGIPQENFDSMCAFLTSAPSPSSSP
jgi:hypothetical protein